jgi:hypothetical protein
VSNIEIDMIRVQLREVQTEVAQAMQGIGQMIAELHRRVEGLELDLQQEIDVRVSGEKNEEVGDLANPIPGKAG